MSDGIDNYGEALDHEQDDEDCLCDECGETEMNCLCNFDDDD
jgi:hypothetical protein